MLLGLGIAPEPHQPLTRAEATTFTVNSLADTDDGTCDATNCTLREAIAAALVAGGEDEINFSVTGTINLTSRLDMLSDLTINGGGITLDGGNATRIMIVYIGRTVTLNDLSFQNGLFSSGGAILNNNGTLTITNSTFSSNTAAVAEGGAIYNSGTLTITNSTFSGNTAVEGGAIYNGSGTLTISNSTFSGNTATSSGGTLYGSSGTINVASSLIVDGTCSGTITNGGNNLSFNATGCPDPGNNPLLGPLQNNGGPTDTMLPVLSGPAVDVYAAPCATTTDQRGITRPQGLGCDIGATEQDGRIALAAGATCVNESLVVTILAGNGPFIITGTGTGLPLVGVNVGTHALTGPGTWTDVTVTETTSDGESTNLGNFTCVVSTDTPTSTPGPVTLVASAACVDENLAVTISAGDGPFNITVSAGMNMPVMSVGLGTTVVQGPEKWDNLTVAEVMGDEEVINLGQFKCRTDERPMPLTPVHSSRSTNPFPLFSWTAITTANNYRVFVFDNASAATRTVDIRQNSGGLTSMTLTAPLPDGRLFWRVRGRQNRVWSLWSVRFTLFKDLVVPLMVSTPVPTIDLNPPSGGDSGPNPVPTVGPAPTFPAPPNSR